jgi:hypothetical protein
MRVGQLDFGPVVAFARLAIIPMRVPRFKLTPEVTGILSAGGEPCIGVDTDLENGAGGELQ